MDKFQLQSVAVIVNDVLPQGDRIDVWEHDRDTLASCLEGAFGFARCDYAPASQAGLILFADT